MGPQVLCPVQLRSSVRCVKSGSRIRILSSVLPSPIISFASLAPGIVSRGRGLDQRSVVAYFSYVVGSYRAVFLNPGLRSGKFFFS